MPLDPHVRYAALVARQLVAIRAEDLAEFEALADARDLAAAEIARGGRMHEEAARLALAEAAELDAQILAVIRKRRDSLRARLRAEDAGRAHALAYARAATAGSGHTLDVSL